MSENVAKKKRKMPQRSRKWLLTVNNPVDHGFTHDVIKDTLQLIEGLDYWCMCDEIGGETSCYHTHFFIMRKNSAMRFTHVKKLFPSAHIDPGFGTAQENRDYIRKEGKWVGTEKELTNLPETFEEFGDCPQEEQGKRNDLNELYEMIKEGLSNYEILEENPHYMEKLDRIDAVREMLKEEKFKDMQRDVVVEYWFGAPGTGKTSGVYALYPRLSDVYRIYDPRFPWDTYRGQDVVVFDDFHSAMFLLPIMLNWITGYPTTLRSRYRQKIACFTKVYILSNVPLDQQYQSYQRDDPDTWRGFLRRIHKVRYFDSSGKVIDYASVEDYLHHRQETNIKETNEYFKQNFRPRQQSLRMDVDEDGFIKLSAEDMQQIEDMFNDGG